VVLDDIGGAAGGTGEDLDFGVGDHEGAFEAG
jgi:hypothetical protein